MSISNYKSVPDYKVEKWLQDSIPELTDYQKQRIRQDELVRSSPYYFFERRKRTKNIWLRLTIVLMPMVWMLLVLLLPFKYLFTGSWGYENKMVAWYHKWANNLGL